VAYVFTLTNLGPFTDRFVLTLSGDWQAELSSSLTGPLAHGESAEVLLRVQIPDNIGWYGRSVTTLRVTSTLDGSVYRDGRATTSVIPFQVWMPIVGRK
jgi:hypothetical protein